METDVRPDLLETSSMCFETVSGSSLATAEPLIEYSDGVGR